jgi:hypothetical protein
LAVSEGIMAKKQWRLPLWNSGYPPKYALVDEIDYIRLNEAKWRLNKSGYVFRFNRETSPTFLHSEICPAPKGMVTDHENRDPLDCRRSNLRVVTKAESQWNKGPYKTNKSGYKGVSFDINRNLWQASITANGKRRFLGRFSTVKQAARAYDAAAAELHGEYGYLNLPARRK